MEVEDDRDDRRVELLKIAGERSEEHRSQAKEVTSSRGSVGAGVGFLNIIEVRPGAFS